MAFIVFVIIVVLTWLQRRAMAEDRVSWRTRRRLAKAAALRQDSARATAGSVR